MIQSPRPLSLGFCVSIVSPQSNHVRGVVTLEIQVFGWPRQECLGNGPVIVPMLDTVATKAALTSETPEPA